MSWVEGPVVAWDREHCLMVMVLLREFWLGMESSEMLSGRIVFSLCIKRNFLMATLGRVVTLPLWERAEQVSGRSRRGMILLDTLFRDCDGGLPSRGNEPTQCRACKGGGM